MIDALKKYCVKNFGTAKIVAKDLFKKPDTFTIIDYAKAVLPTDVRFFLGLINWFQTPNFWNKIPFFSYLLETLWVTITTVLLIGLGAAFSWIIMPLFELNKQKNALYDTPEHSVNDDDTVANFKPESHSSSENDDEGRAPSPKSLWQRICGLRWSATLKGLCHAPILSVALIVCCPLILIEQSLYLCIYAIQCAIFIVALLLLPLFDLMLFAPAAFAIGLTIAYSCLRLHSGSVPIPMTLGALEVIFCCLAGFYVLSFLSNYKLQGHEAARFKAHLLIIGMIACIVGVACHLAMLHLFYSMGLVLCTLLLPWLTILYFNHAYQHRVQKLLDDNNHNDAQSSTTLNKLTQCLQTTLVGICAGMLAFSMGWCTLNLACTLTFISIALAWLQYAYNIQITSLVHKVPNPTEPENKKEEKSEAHTQPKTLLAWCKHECKKIIDAKALNNDINLMTEIQDTLEQFNQTETQNASEHVGQKDSKSLSSMDTTASKTPKSVIAAEQLQKIVKAMQNTENSDDKKKLQTFSDRFQVLAHWQAFCNIWNSNRGELLEQLQAQNRNKISNISKTVQTQSQQTFQAQVFLSQHNDLAMFELNGRLQALQNGTKSSTLKQLPIHLKPCAAFVKTTCDNLTVDLSVKIDALMKSRAINEMQKRLLKNAFSMLCHDQYPKALEHFNQVKKILKKTADEATPKALGPSSTQR